MLPLYAPSCELFVPLSYHASVLGMHDSLGMDFIRSYALRCMLVASSYSERGLCGVLLCEQAQLLTSSSAALHVQFQTAMR